MICYSVHDWGGVPLHPSLDAKMSALSVVVLEPTPRGHAVANQGWIATRTRQLQQPPAGSSRQGKIACNSDIQTTCQLDMAPATLQRKRAAAEAAAAPIAKRSTIRDTTAAADSASAAAPQSQQPSAGQRPAASDAIKVSY